MKRFDLWIGIAIGLALITASWRRWAPYSLTETLGFVTGAACVYLVVRQNVWNFPLGIANNIFFLILFVSARLYGDAGLQVIYPISGTAVRSNPLGCWDFLEPPVRAWYAKRICLVGAESTGKTTLAQMLAERYQTVWVPEYGREYSERKLSEEGEYNWRHA
jgi:hypothetical protein